jgi:acyl dehydratase
VPSVDRRVGPTRTPAVEVTADLVATLVACGGYTHPLFHDGAPATRPLPGQAVLLLMGGLVEQSSVLDDAVALLELGPARFHAMARPGSRLTVLVEETDTRAASVGRIVSTYHWRAVDDVGSTVAETRAVMLRRDSSADPAQEAPA